jgi:hypothetical protein
MRLIARRMASCRPEVKLFFLNVKLARHTVRWVTSRARKHTSTAAARPWRLRGVPIPISARMNSPRLQPAACTSSRFAMFVCPRRWVRRRRPVSCNSRRPSVRFRGEPTALVVGEAQASGSKLLALDAVLVLQIVDDVALLLVDPRRERDQDELRRMRQPRHGGQATSSTAPRVTRPIESDRNWLELANFTEE